MTGALRRRLVFASAIAVALTSALLPGSGLGSSAAEARSGQKIPVGLAAAIHARLGGGDESGPMLGYSVSLSADGTTALVGAPGGFDLKGAAFVFHAAGAGSWSSTGTPTATLTSSPHPDSGELFGWNVALSADGTTAFVGAPTALGGTGAIYVFHVAAEDAWASSSAPTATLTLESDVLGIGLALSTDGTTLVAGAPFANDLAGAAYVFHVSSEDAWASASTPTAMLSNADESVEDEEVGWSVAISGDGTTALLSDYGNTDGGGAYIFHVSAEDAWTDSASPTAVLSDANLDADHALGATVALSADGTVAVLTVAPALGSVESTSAVEVFRAAGEAAWPPTTTAPTAILTIPDVGLDDFFEGGAATISADGKTILVAAPGLDYPHGGAYVFHVSGEEAWATSSTPTAVLVNAGGHTNVMTQAYGLPALSADGTTGLVGAFDHDNQTGAADIFHVADASSWASTSTPNAVLTVSTLFKCTVPRVIGLKVPAARAALKARHCRLGTVTRVAHPRSKKGRVFSQRRKAGLRLPNGTKVNVKVAR